MMISHFFRLGLVGSASARASRNTKMKNVNPQLLAFSKSFLLFFTSWLSPPPLGTTLLTKSEEEYKRERQGEVKAKQNNERRRLRPSSCKRGCAIVGISCASPRPAQ